MSSIVAGLLTSAGLEINGPRSFDPKIHDFRLFDRVLAQGSLGLGEAYMENWWDCDDLSEFFHRIYRARLDEKASTPLSLWHSAKAWLLNPQSRRRSRHVGRTHYDLDNDLYRAMLDRRMVYTCGYWKDARDLDEAQEAKLDLVCRKLGLERGMHVLDIGCGWGSFLKFAAAKYGIRGVGITVSREQARLARELCSGLDIEIRLQDYRQLDGVFDRVVSLGMYEHVGYKNYSTFAKIAARCLKDDGLFLLHTIGGNKSETCTDPWIEKYIFPGGMIPSIAQIGRSLEGRFVMEDWHNFGTDYDRTLVSWYENFHRNWPKLSGRFDPTFYRCWKFYLLGCAGSFRARKNHLWQIVLSKDGVANGYASLR